MLSNFNYFSQVFSPCIDSITLQKIQKVQNSCLRYIFGIRKYQHISHKLKDCNWLNMTNRFSLHLACLFNKVIKTKQPSYLYKKIIFRGNAHNVNIRNKNLIKAPKHRSSLFKRSFSYNIFKNYNNLPPHLQIETKDSSFKRKLRKILLEAQTCN